MSLSIIIDLVQQLNFQLQYYNQEEGEERRGRRGSGRRRGLSVISQTRQGCRIETLFTKINGQLRLERAHWAFSEN